MERKYFFFTRQTYSFVSDLDKMGMGVTVALKSIDHTSGTSEYNDARLNLKLGSGEIFSAR